MPEKMKIHPDYTPIQITLPDDRHCSSIAHAWRNIYDINNYNFPLPKKETYVTHVDLARKYNLIYTFIKTDKLQYLKFPYITINNISAENIQFYKLDKLDGLHIILQKEINVDGIITFEGNEFWHKNGKLHRDNDLPAVIYANSRQKWYQNGKLHRDNDLPAVIYNDGSQLWYQNGLCHRNNDLPAIIYSDGTQIWYQKGYLHRDNDKPAIIYKDGSQYWYQNGKPHRDNDLPAVIEANGKETYWKNGLIVRVTKP